MGGRFSKDPSIITAVAALIIGIGSTGASANDREACQECHGDAELQREADNRPGSSVFVDEELLDRSVHEGMECVDCHVTASDDHEKRLPAANCSDCHEDALEVYSASLHGQALAAGVDDAPTCGDCHGAHDIQPATEAESLVHPTRLAQTCAACHADVDFIERRSVSLASPLTGYEQSVHFRALQEGDGGASCIDCHEYHHLLKPSDPGSSIHRANIPATCGRCHEPIAATYEQSIHGRALAFGSSHAPSCVDCHGEHEIRGPEDPESSVYPSHIAQTTCVWCHESERLVRRYGLPAERGQTYADSYHGLADRGGSTTVANCASCHGIHDILPSKDPASSIHPANLPATCGKCHPGAGENFALGAIHAAEGVGNGEHAVVNLVRRLYIGLIVVVVGGMLAHNALDLSRHFASQRLPTGTDYLRFNAFERTLHAVMALCFLSLVYSGFALKFPEAWWASPLDWLSNGEDGRSLIHRVAAVTMVAVCVLHLGQVATTRRGREQMYAMRPRLQDVRDAIQMIAYYLRARASAPAFERFNYVEKLEYWALVWGTAIMSVTGFALWFEEYSLQFVPLWGLDVVTVVHYYEAWLATLAIVVWHFYFVIFNPKVYPMSLVWLTGRLSAEAMAEEHGLEFDRLQAAGPPAQGPAAEEGD